jgi:hypothetical protein
MFLVEFSIVLQMYEIILNYASIILKIFFVINLVISKFLHTFAQNHTHNDSKLR